MLDYLSFYVGHLFLSITKTSFKVNLVGYMKTVGFGSNINTTLQDHGKLDMILQNKKFFDIAMATKLDYLVTDRVTNLENMNPLVSKHE